MEGGKVPGYVDGYGRTKPFKGLNPGRTKLMPGLRAAIEASGLKDGGTISFHHHLRNGDFVINMVLAEIAAMGIRDITVAASSLFPAHAPMADRIREGVAVNPRRGELRERLLAHGVRVVEIEALREIANARATSEARVAFATERVVAVVEYRDGTVIDVVRQSLS